MSAERTPDGTRLFRTTDGRVLAAKEFGEPAGKPVFYFHGFPGSRLEAAVGHAAALRHGVRLIALDRPGYGLSDSQPGRRLSCWPRDVACAADALRLGRFAVAGVSGGGPFAAACAALLPDRVSAAGLLCSLGPIESLRGSERKTMMLHNRLGLVLAGRLPWLVRPAIGLMGPLLRRLDRLAVAHLARSVVPPDDACLARDEVRQMLTRTFREGLRQGGAGLLADGLIFGRSWDVELARIRTRVRLWHGERDGIVPASMARWLESAIPGARATYYAEEGHFSLIFDRIDAILAEFGSRS